MMISKYKRAVVFLLVSFCVGRISGGNPTISCGPTTYEVSNHTYDIELVSPTEQKLIISERTLSGTVESRYTSVCEQQNAFSAIPSIIDRNEIKRLTTVIPQPVEPYGFSLFMFEPHYDEPPKPPGNYVKIGRATVYNATDHPWVYENARREILEPKENIIREPWSSKTNSYAAKSFNAFLMNVDTMYERGMMRYTDGRHFFEKRGDLLKEDIHNLRTYLFFVMTSILKEPTPTPCEPTKDFSMEKITNCFSGTQLKMQAHNEFELYLYLNADLFTKMSMYDINNRTLDLSMRRKREY